MKRGRPRFNIDLEEVKKLAGLGCTDEDMAGWFEVDRKTIWRWKKNKDFRAAMELGKAQGRVSLRRTLFQMAQQNKQGSAAAIIFLAKHLLGFHDGNHPRTDELPENAANPNDATRFLREIYGLPPESDPPNPNTNAVSEPEASNPISILKKDEKEKDQ